MRYDLKQIEKDVRLVLDRNKAADSLLDEETTTLTLNDIIEGIACGRELGITTRLWYGIHYAPARLSASCHVSDDRLGTSGHRTDNRRKPIVCKTTQPLSGCQRMSAAACRCHCFLPFRYGVGVFLLPRRRESCGAQGAVYSHPPNRGRREQREDDRPSAQML